MSCRNPYSFWILGNKTLLEIQFQLLFKKKIVCNYVQVFMWEYFTLNEKQIIWYLMMIPGKYWHLKNSHGMY